MNTTPEPTSRLGIGPGGRAELAGRYLVEAGGTALSVEVGQAAGCTNAARRTEMLALMRERGWLTGRGTVRLTPAGWARWSALVPDTSAGEVLDRALADWPYAHRAFLELLLSAVIARHHLGQVHPDTHLGFMAIGETGTGKSAMAELVVRLLGLPPELAVVDLPAQAAGAVLGRREQGEGGGYRLVPNASTRQPFVFFDEVDKADANVRRATWSYFQGKRQVAVDGQVHELLPTPMLAANPPSTRGAGSAGGGDRYAALRPEYRRRSVVLDTGYLRGHGHQLERVLRGYYAGAAASDRLDLARLVPPDQQLSAPGVQVLDTLREVLTAAGREDFPGVRPLAVAALGRAALMGTSDHVLAAYATGCAYLWATETVPGQVVDRWVLDAAALRSHLGAGAEDLVAAMARAKAGREQHRRDQDQRRRETQLSHDLAHGDVVEARAVLVAQLDQVAAGIDGRQLHGASTEVRSRAKGLRARLTQLRTSAAAAETDEDVRGVAAAAGHALQRAQELRADELARRQREQEDRRELDRQRQAEADDNRRHAQQLKAQNVAHREQLRANLRDCRATLRPLEQAWGRNATRPGESPFSVLRELRVAGQPLLRWEPATPPALPQSRRGQLALVLAQTLTAPAMSGTWRVVMPTAGAPSGFAGTEYSCPGLRSWGPATRAVLFGWMAALYAVEDGLQDDLAVPARQRRRRPRLDVTAIAGARGNVSPQLAGRPRQLGIGARPLS